MLKETLAAEEHFMKEHRRLALVTGAAHGIGEGIASRLAHDGYDVALLDINGTRCAHVAEAIGREWRTAALPLTADVGNEDDVRTAIANIKTHFGRLDALINNAGIPDPVTEPIEALERATWDRYLEVNLTGCFLVSKHAVPLLREHGGAIVNIASIHAIQSDVHHNMAYAATKGGTVAFTHALALSLGPAIRVNCISPGWIDVRDDAERKESPLRDIDHAQHPVGRVGKPADIAALVAFLLSPDAGFITAQNFIADGGMTRKMAFVV